jgi:hypothetical protein
MQKTEPVHPSILRYFRVLALIAVFLPFSEFFVSCEGLRATYHFDRTDYEQTVATQKQQQLAADSLNEPPAEIEAGSGAEEENEDAEANGAGFESEDFSSRFEYALFRMLFPTNESVSGAGLIVLQRMPVALWVGGWWVFQVLSAVLVWRRRASRAALVMDVFAVLMLSGLLWFPGRPVQVLPGYWIALSVTILLGSHLWYTIRKVK